MKRALFLAVGALIALQPLQADARIYSGTPFDVEYQNFLGGSGVNGTWGVQVGPYTSRFEASSQTLRSTATPTFSVYCVDYLHSAGNSDGLVYVTGITSGGNFSKTRLNDFSRYQRSAYLASLFDTAVWTSAQTFLDANFAGTFTQNNVWGGLHAAIWNISTGPTTLGSGQTAVARDYFLGLANTNGGSFNTNGWYVLSEKDVGLTNSRSGQEFLMRAETRSVPEPSSVLLTLTGLFLLVGVNRKRLAETYV